MKLALVGEWLSSNLGDRAIGDALAISVTDLGHQVAMVDLSARESSAMSTQASGVGFAVGRLPAPVYRIKGALRWRLTERRRSRSYFKSQTADVDGVLIGGGQLLADHFLNFPRRIALLCHALSESQLRYGFVSCGMGELSAPARDMLKPAIASAEFVGLRDALSRDRFLAQFPGFQEKAIYTPDAAILQLASGKPREKGAPGLGVIAKNKVSAFLPELAGWSDARYTNYWVEVASVMANPDGAVTVFSNGEPADRGLAELVAERLVAGGMAPTVRFPMRLEELVSTIETCSYVVAARLHAVLLALRADVPAVGIEWDPKVRSVLSEFGQEHRCIKFSDDVTQLQAQLRKLHDLEAASEFRCMLEHARSSLRCNLAEFIEVVR
ncbi:MAG: polysaccharide pyruvyl transferase family protein [Pseudomonadota bacterium]